MAGAKRLRDVLNSQEDVEHSSYIEGSDDETQPHENHLDDFDDETQPPDTVDSDIEAQEDKNVDEVYEDIEIKDPEGNVNKRRGQTRAKDVWTLQKGYKVVVKCNNLGQPINKSGGILGGWLGTVARKKQFCSIEYSDWRKIPGEDKNTLWKLTKVYFDIPDGPEVKKWVLASIRVKWKNYKHELKCTHFLPENTKQQIIDNVPQGISPSQWKKLVEYWYSKESLRLSTKGKEARKHHKTPHTCGSKSFARFKEEFEVKHGKQPGRVDFFAMTRKKKDGTFVNSEVAKIMDTATNLIAQRSSASQDQDENIVQNEVFFELLGEEQHGRVKGFGLGVTPTQVNGQIKTLKDKRSSELESMQKVLGDMQSNYERNIENLIVDYEGKIAKLKEDHEKKMEALQAINDNFRRDMHELKHDFLQFKDMMSQDMRNFSEFESTGDLDKL